VKANERIYVIGDVHGQFEKLARLLRDTKLVGNTLSWTGGSATLWFIGDFFDRGPDGIAVVDLVMRLQSEANAAGGRVESLLGNHEVVLLAARRFGTRATTGPGGNFVADWEYNGGCDTDLARITLQHMDWIMNLPAMALVGDWLFVHADAMLYMNYGSSLAEVNEAFRTLLQGSDASAWDELLGGFSRRREFGNEHDDGVETVTQFLHIFGGQRLLHCHTPISYLIGQPPEQITAPFAYAGGQCVNVDGGMYLGGPGFVYELPRRQELAYRTA
jgi:hypothetical protein